jgi:heptosyltransferase I
MPRILFIKTSSLGDVIHNCPAVSDVAACLPGAEIDWVVEEQFAAVAQMHRAVRRAIPVALRRWRRALWRPAVWSEIARFRRLLAAERYDAVLDSQGLLKSALLCRLARGVRHGMDGASAREPLAARLYDVRHAVPPELHAVERNRRLAAAALRYPSGSECEYGLGVKAGAPGDAGAPYVVLLTMTSRADKLWADEQWTELARALGLRAMLPWGSDAERARAERIGRGVPDALVPGRMALPELGRLLRGARQVIGLDSGPTHLAAALGVPTIALFCGSDPGLTGLYGSAAAKNLGRPGKPPSVGEVLEAMA